MHPVCYHSLGFLGISISIGVGVAAAANSISRGNEGDFATWRQKTISVLTGILAAGLYYSSSISLLESRNL